MCLWSSSQQWVMRAMWMPSEKDCHFENGLEDRTAIPLGRSFSSLSSDPHWQEGLRLCNPSLSDHWISSTAAESAQARLSAAVTGQHSGPPTCHSWRTWCRMWVNPARFWNILLEKSPRWNPVAESLPNLLPPWRDVCLYLQDPIRDVCVNKVRIFKRQISGGHLNCQEPYNSQAGLSTPTTFCLDLCLLHKMKLIHGTITGPKTCD